MNLTIIHKLKSYSAFQFALVICFVAISCSDDFKSPAIPQGSTIAAIASGSDDFDILVAALTQTGLASTLNNNNSGQFTVFAPVDAAFLTYLQGVYSDPTLTEDGAITKLQSLTNVSTPLSIGTLATRLNYHLISSEIKSAQITGAQTFTTINGARISVSLVGADVLINANTGATGGKVTAANVDASNGVIHAIDKVLSAPATNTTVLTPFGMSVSYSTATPTISGGLETGADATGTDFDVFAYALRKSKVAFVLVPNKAPLPDFTIFAPTDNAFLAFLSAATEADAIATVKAMTETEAADLVKYHILSGRYLSTDLSAGRVMNTLLTGESFTIALSADPTPIVSLVDANAATDPVITAVNNVHNNGAVHTIDAVLQSN